MSSEKFSFEINGNELGWSYPATAPDLTDDQARTLALLKLVHAIEGLAGAVRQAYPVDYPPTGDGDDISTTPVKPAGRSPLPSGGREAVRKGGDT